MPIFSNFKSNFMNIDVKGKKLYKGIIISLINLDNDNQVVEFVKLIDNNTLQVFHYDNGIKSDAKLIINDDWSKNDLYINNKLIGTYSLSGLFNKTDFQQPNTGGRKRKTSRKNKKARKTRKRKNRL